MRAVISHDDVWNLLIFAMRYAMGRSTFAPETVADAILAESQLATPRQCRSMAKHIREESSFMLRNRRYDREHHAVDWPLPPDDEGISEFTDLLPMLDERAKRDK